ncbi:MAG: TolC family protein [Deltaproteobacteria bacterium]|nr:TolC family protein [Deltaproteobacteria bacterium]
MQRARARAGDVAVAEVDVDVAAGQTVAARSRSFNPEVSIAAGPAYGGGQTVLDYEVSLSQTFELGGKRDKRTAAARAHQAAASARLGYQRERAAARARRAYNLAVIARQRLAADTAGEQVALEVKAAADDRLRLGAGTQLEVNVAGASVGRARHERVNAERRYVLALSELAAAVAAPAGAVIEPATDVVELPTPGVDEAGALRQAARRRGDVVAFVHDQAAAKGEAALAGALATPDLTLSLTYGRSEGTHVGMIGVAIPIPLLNRNKGGRMAASASLARARLVTAVAQRERDRDVRGSYRGYVQARESVGVFAREVVEALDANLDLARQSLQTGKIGIFEFNVVRRDLFDTVLARLDALEEATDARFALETAMGASVEEQP